MAIQEVFKSHESEEHRLAEEAFDNTAIELFSTYKIYEHFEPRIPNVVVRILPKDLMTPSGLYIPDLTVGNKPVYEGIVLRIWKPRAIELTLTKDEKRSGFIKKEITLKSELEIGDHVLFPHFSGQPLPGLNEDKYRVIPEGLNTHNGQVIFGNDTGVIVGKVNYKRPSVDEVFELISSGTVLKMSSDGISTKAYKEQFIKLIKENFDISVKIKGSVTTSGKNESRG